jgi:hypothetical protein
MPVPGGGSIGPVETGRASVPDEIAATLSGKAAVYQIRDA